MKKRDNCYKLIDIFLVPLINKAKTIIEYYINKNIKFGKKEFKKISQITIKTKHKDLYFYVIEMDSMLIFDYLFKNDIKIEYIKPVITNSNPIYRNYLIEKKVLIFLENVN